MLKQFFAFEWRYHVRQLSFPAAALMFFAAGFALTARAFGPANVDIDSSYSVAQTVALLSLFSVFILAVFSANAIDRDRETGMEAIVFTTAVTKTPFLVSRFAGAAAAALTAFSLSLAGMFVARFMPWQDPDRLGSVTLIPYLWAWLVIAVPNVLFVSALMFAVTVRTRNVLANQVASVLLIVLYLAAAAVSGSPLMAASAPAASEGLSLASLLDPFGLSAFFEQTRHWTPAARNTRLLPLTGVFLVNRLLLLAGSLALLGVIHRTFAFRRRAEQPRKAIESDRGSGALSAAGTHVYEPVAVRPTGGTGLRPLVALELRTLLLNRPYLVMLVAWIGLAIFELISEATHAEYGTATYPTIGLILGTIAQPLALFLKIQIVYAAAEIVWRERALKLAGILQATPVRNGVFVAAKCIALALMVVLTTVTGVLDGAVVQLVRGWPVHSGALATSLYYLALPLILLALVSFVIQTLIPHKYLGMIVVLVLAAATESGYFGAGLHPLLQFPAAPPVIHSELNGFGRTAPFHSLMLYWSAVALGAVALASARWRGQRERRGLVVPIICLLIAAVTGGVLFPQIRQTDMVAWRAGYEKRYKPLQSDPHPRIRQIRASIDLFPSARRYRVRGTYIVANETPAAIGQVLIALRRGDEPSLVRFDPPITPGGIRAISFSVTHANLDPFAPNHTIVENGSYLTSLDALPALGYRSGWELDDPHQRRRQGLPPAVPRSESEIPLAEWVSLDLRVSTEADQTVVAPGRLLSNDVHGQRRTFHYRTAAPVPNQFAVSSARYAVSTVMRDGVSIEIYHHPGHEQNVAGMQTAAANAIEWFGSGFGPYTRDHLRIAEVPIPGFSAFAQPGVVFFGENRGFLIDARDSRRLDLLTRRVAHEIAHQWFGYTLVPADVPGASTLTESLTKYAELLALERTRGKAQVGASLAYELDLYLSGRTGVVGAEPPLTRARADQPFLYYRKGAIALYAIKELIGEAAMNGALRRLIAEQGGVARRPTTAHLVSALKRAAPPGDHALIDEWLGAVVLYDIGLLAATAVARGSDYETTLLIHAAKDGTPFDESVDVALYGESKQVQIERHLLQAGQQAITVRSPFRPLAAAVDPYHTRVDRNRFDNERQID